MKPIGLKEYLEEDPSLTRKLTYEEFQNSIVSFADSDDGIEEAYKTYKKFIEKNKKDRHELTAIIFGRQSHKHMCWRVTY